MAATSHLDITGAKGGESKPKTPVEAPDSLQSTNVAKILLAVGEGEFAGAPTDRDIYLDNTPIMDASGNVNFPGVKWEWRRGSIEQDYIQGIPAVENETTINVELRSDNPFSRALSDTKLSAVRVRLAWPRLLSQDANGNTNGYRIEYAIDIATDGGAYAEAHRGAVDGKTSTGYQRSIRVNLPKSTSGWMMRVRRITPNANKGTIADTMTVAGYTEIIDEKLRYPNTALLYVEFDAQQFQNIPAVTVKCKAKRWPVPSNYDPINRTYTGVWDGTFKQAWTNNPAFVTYGLCIENRFGLGKRVKSWMVDKWEMYRIAQYCDQMVPNGVGGQEPRFLCDMNLQGRSEAWVLLRDLSAIYRGMVYWAHGSLFMQADMPRAQDIDYVFTRANVIDGDFVYGGAERNTHYSRALVSYDNPANNYDTDVIPVTDLALQRRYRDRPIEISAIGCTRASEAQRRGKWALLSNNQDRTVTFKTGIEGRIPLPGYVIPVADELVAGRPNGGRISAVAGLVVTLDRDTPIKAGDRLILNLPNGTAQGRTVKSVKGRAVTVTTDYSIQPEPQLQWAIDYQDLAVQLFRVLRTVRTEEGQYEVSALEFNPSKFAAIDTGAKLDERPVSVIPVTTVQPPASITLTSASAVDQGIAVSTMTIAWPVVQGAVAYDVEWRKDNSNWVRLQRTGANSVDVVGVYAGAYLARVRAVSSFDISSIWRDSILTQLKGKVGLPPAVSFLKATPLVYGTALAWGFPAGAEDTQRTEIWQSATTSRDDATKLGDFAYPQAEHEIHGLAAGVSFFYWARLIDRSGNVGPWFPNGVGINGQSSSDQSEYEAYFKDKITNGSLYPALREEIALISGPPSLPGSVNSRLKELDDQVTQAQADLQEQIDAIADLADSLPYDPAKTYEVGQAVLGADGKLYQAKQAVPVETPPPSAAYWTDIGQAVQTATGLAARVTTVETKVSEQDGKLTAQAERIDGVQSSLTTTNQNVTAAQRAADAANTLAGGKGKVIIQSATPATADRLAQNLWIDTTNNANTPKRWTGSAWMAVTDKAATDAAAAAASATALAKTKADASVVDTLSSKVTQQGDSITSQGQALTGLQNNLTITNQNVTAAQQAAQDAATAAGAKGKVIVQSAAPAAADRLVQNLWIDTTSNANTPKRWTGSAWVAVTDKVATDAAAAAASALSQVASKADASTVQQLSNTVSQQGQTISAQGGAITSIQATVGSIGGSGVNLVPAEYSYFASAAAPSYIYGAQIAATVPDAMGLGGYVLRTTSTTSTPSATIYTAVGTDAYENYRIATQPGKFIVSYYARADVAGHEVALFLRTRDSAGAAANAATIVQALATEWARYSFVVDHSAATYANKDRMAVGIQFNRSGAAGRVVYWDRFMVEPMIGSNAQPSTFSVGGSYNQANALAAATQSLDGRVSQTESGLTSQGSAITQLRNTVAGKADNSALQDLQSNVTQQGNTLTAQGQAVTKLQSTVGGIGGSGTNLLADDYSWLTSTSLPAMVMGSSLARVGVPVSASDSGFGILCTFPSTAVGQFMMLSPSNNLAGWNVRIEPGVYLVSMYIQGSAEGAAMVSLYSGTHRQSGNIPYSTERSRITFPITVADSAKVGITIYPNRTGLAAGQSVTIDSVMIEKRVGESNVPSPFVAGPSARAVSGQATAISQLNTTVNQQGTAINAQAERVDGLYVQINPELSGSEDGFAGSAQKFVGVWSEQSARIEGDVAQAQRTDRVEIRQGETNALVQQVSKAVVDLNSSTAQQFSQVQVQQGQTTAAVQQVSSAVATLDGKVNAQVTIKAQTIAGGRKVTAGLALGSDGETSEFLAFAQRFAVVDEVSGQLVLPFVVQNGQVFINQAVINTAFIREIILGMTLRSQATDAQGRPLVEINLQSGTFALRGQDGNGSLLINNGGVYVYDAGGAERTAVGRLS